jgi:hypothetical protein
LTKKILHKLHSEVYSLITELTSSYKDVCQKVVDHRFNMCNKRVPSFYGFLRIFIGSNNALHTSLNLSDSATILVRVTMPEDGHVRLKHDVEESM